MTPLPRIRLTHIITGLPAGGAQSMLHNLARWHDRQRFDMEVISLTERGPVGDAIAALGVPVRAFGMGRGLGALAALPRLAGWLACFRPHIVQTWLYHADLLGGVAAVLARRRPVVWNIRHSDLRPGSYRRSTIWTARACAVLSRHVPDRIVCNSAAAAAVHVRLGYRADRFVIIPNGIDSDSFMPDAQARIEVRRELGWGLDVPVVGLFGRFHPQKGHLGFLAAAAELRRRHPEARFLLCGENVERANPALAREIDRLGLGECVVLLGVRRDMPRLTAALDVAVSASGFGEAFANVLIEAMACAVPCVATDVGEARAVVADTGRVVPPDDAAALAAALADVLGLDPKARRALGEKARQRALARYDIREVVRRYESLYAGLSS
ncbi:MAG: glycosyltransferase [Alphaproteobacteria bacterium]|nr:glycosyltransferase [Alphaproteobacteria bacterium]